MIYVFDVIDDVCTITHQHIFSPLVEAERHAISFSTASEISDGLTQIWNTLINVKRTLRQHFYESKIID